MNNRYIPFYLIITSAFLIIVSPDLFSNGMFMDGLWYAVISRNMAIGFGTFWDPHFSETIYFHFREHPPLAFGLQSIFFRIFGDHLLVEQLYSIGTFFITGWIIVLIWRAIPENKYRSLGWLPLLLWIVTPVVNWSARNNMLENTMMIFTSLSVLFALKSYTSKRYFRLSLSGIFIFFAFLTKGFVAFYPLSLPFWMFVFKKEKSFHRTVTDIIVMLLSILIPFLFIYVFTPEGITSLIQYINKQVIGSIENGRTVDTRFFIVIRFVQELLPAIVLALISIVTTYKRKVIKTNLSWIYFFVLLGLSGVLPVMVSMKQSGFYILTTYPFFSIAISLYIAPRVKLLIDKINLNGSGFKIFKVFTVIILTGSIIFASFQTRRTGRNKEMISDVYKIIEKVKKEKIISIDPDLFPVWALYGYFQRYAKISLDSKNLKDHEYLIVPKGRKYFNGYIKVPIKLNLYDLYKRKTN